MKKLFDGKVLRHHAYIVIGEPEASLSEFLLLLEEKCGRDFIAPTNADLLVVRAENFGIDDSRAVKAFQSKKALSSHGKFALLAFGAITGEAQNALLKTFEEPGMGNHYLIMARDLGLFLPTLVSRCEVVVNKGDRFGADLVKKATEFLASDVVKRMKLKDKMAGGGGEKEFIYCLEWLYRNKVDLAKAKSEEIKALEELNKITTALSSSSFYKIIIEHLALVLPQK